jgi:hypothetical protein
MSRTSQYIFQKLNIHESGYYFLLNEDDIIVECILVSYNERNIEASTYQKIGDSNVYLVEELPQLIKENYSLVYTKAIIQ